MRLFDSHSHINAREFDADRDDVITRMREAGLEGALVVACDYGEEKDLFTVLDLAPDFCTAPGPFIPNMKTDANAVRKRLCQYAAIREFLPSEKRGLTTTGARAT